MNIRRWLLAVMICGVLAGCGDDDGGVPDACCDAPDVAVVDAAPPDAGPLPVGCSLSGEGTFASVTEDVTFTASTDGITLHGTLFVPDGDGTFAVVVLLHQYCTLRTDWMQTVPLAEELAERGFLVLAYDARGFGYSTENDTLSYCGEMNTSLFQPMIADLGDALDFLATRPEANLDCVGVGGGSMGSSVALIYGASDPRVQTVVMLSPGLAYLGLSTAPAMAEWNPRPALMIAAEDDVESVADMQSLAAQGDAVTAVTVTGAAHGASILAHHPDEHAQVLQWFSDLL